MEVAFDEATCRRSNGDKLYAKKLQASKTIETFEGI